MINVSMFHLQSLRLLAVRVELTWLYENLPSMSYDSPLLSSATWHMLPAARAGSSLLLLARPPGPAWPLPLEVDISWSAIVLAGAGTGDRSCCLRYCVYPTTGTTTTTLQWARRLNLHLI